MIFYSVQHDASKQTEPGMERHGDLMWESERTGKDMRVISRETNRIPRGFISILETFIVGVYSYINGFAGTLKKPEKGTYYFESN